MWLLACLFQYKEKQTKTIFLTDIPMLIKICHKNIPKVNGVIEVLGSEFAEWRKYVYLYFLHVLKHFQWHIQNPVKNLK